MSTTRIASSFLFLFLAAAGLGCSSSGELPETSSAALWSTCDDLDGRLAHAAASAPTSASYDDVIEVRTPDCGASFHTAGPSNLGPARLFRVGSMTKSYVAVTTLGLVAEGKLDLDARLDSYLPDAPAVAAAVTLRQLLQHTSGIFNYTDTDEFWAAYKADPMRRWRPSELLALAVAKPPYSAPGAEWHYSNTNFVLLGVLLEKVTGTKIAQLIRTRILEPNALHETFFAGEEPVTGALAPGFDKDGHEIGSSYDPSLAWAAGAIVATPADEARFVELVGSGALLPPVLQAAMTTGVDTPEQGLHYGLGVFLADDSITTLGNAIGHGGDVMGYHSWGWYFPQHKLTIFGAVDSDTADGNDPIAATIKAMDAPPATSTPTPTPAIARIGRISRL